MKNDRLPRQARDTHTQAKVKKSVGGDCSHPEIDSSSSKGDHFLSGFVPFASSFVPAGRNERKVPAIKYSRAKSSGNKKKKGGVPGEEGDILSVSWPLAPPGIRSLKEAAPAKKHPFALSFPYGCPKPVLAE